MFFIIYGFTEREVVVQKPEVQEQKQATTTHTERLKYFKDLELEAKAAYVFDLQTNKEVYARNIDTQLPIASLTKLMTALVALEDIKENQTPVTIVPEALLQDGENGFSLYEQWDLYDLLDVTLVTSSNDGAYAIAASIMPFLTAEDSKNAFVTAMNDKAQQLGLTQTSFLTPTGLDLLGETKPSAFSSARDITTLFAYMLTRHPTLLEPTRETTITRTSLNNRSYKVYNTNQLTDDIPLLIGSKTGFTETAGGNLVVAFDAGLAHPVIIVVLGSTPEGRFNDIKTLIDATLQYASHDA